MRLRKVKSSTKPSYPVPYRVWERLEGLPASVPEAMAKAAVLKRVNQKSWEATPVSGGNSPWAILPPGRFQDMEAIQGTSDWVAGRKGVTADLNGVYMVRILASHPSNGLVQIETRPSAGKTDIGAARRFWIEPEFLYPLLKGAGDFSACHVHVKEQLYILVPNKGIQRADYARADAELKKLKQTRNYLTHFGDLLAKRSTYKLRQKGAPDYVVYNSGSYTFAPYKVVWAELSTTFQAAVFTHGNVPMIGERPYVPDHKVYFADFGSADVAHYVCGVLNSSLIKEYIESHTIQIQVSNIFKHLSIPKFDLKDARHVRLSKLSAQAHDAKSAKNRQEILAQMNILSELILT